MIDNIFAPLTPGELTEILGLTIKKDEENKLVTFLCELSAFTEDSQFNLSFNAPSSTGKSYIPLEISSLFPEEDLIKLGNASPTAFFHEQGEKIDETIYVDLSRKIIIFLDQPNSMLLEKLRPLLSHDEKEITLKITDKNNRGGNRTKTVVVIGYPVVIYCSANNKLDEQEATRFLLLSPETSQEKFHEGIKQAVRKGGNPESFQKWLEGNPERQKLKERVAAIKAERIISIIISVELQRKITDRFLLPRKDRLKPRHQRDIKRLMAIMKVWCLLNLWFRKRQDSMIIVSEEDAEVGFQIWDKLAQSQELGLAPYVYKIYEEVILPMLNEVREMKKGLSRKDIGKKHFEVYGRTLPDWQLRQQILPSLEIAGLIYQEKDGNNMLVYPPGQLTISPGPQEHSESDRGSEIVIG
jgi:hypothetical protein